MAYTFDGPNKRIILSSGTTSISLIDLWSRYKDWIHAGNAGYIRAFYTVGGDIPAIPLYLFIQNGWRIVPQAADHTLSVVDGILEVEGGGDPFVDPVGSYKIRINRESPGIAIGYSSSGSVITPSQIWSYAVEGLTAEEILRLVAAALVGRRVGLGTENEVYYGLDGATARIQFSPSDAAGNGTPIVDGTI